MKKKLDNYNNKQEKIKQLKEEQDEKKKNDALLMTEKRKEKEYKNHLIKLKNDDLIEQRRIKLMDKYCRSEEKIKKQKKENEKRICQKYLEIAIKREDTSTNLIRCERQNELIRQLKLVSIDKRKEILNEIQKKKEEINNKKIEFSQNIVKRKSELLKKVKIILTNGNFKSKDDIYKQVFNEEELGFIGKPGNKNMKANKTSDYDTFFLTQTEINNNEKNKENNNKEKDEKKEDI